MTPRKRGLAPAARAIVTKYREESQSKLVEWLKDGGLLDGASNDLEKVKQQIKRRKMTLKRKHKADGHCPTLQKVTLDDEMQMLLDHEQYYRGEIDENYDLDDPLWSAKINLLQDDSVVSLIDPPADSFTDPPEDLRLSTPTNERYSSGEEMYHEDEDQYPGSHQFFGEGGPDSPTTVVEEVFSCNNALFDCAPSLHITDLFPRTAHEFPPLPTLNSTKRELVTPSPPPISSGPDPSGSYHHAEV